MKRIRYYFLFLPFVLNAQSYPPPSSLITLPTAGTLQRGSFALEMRIQKFGGLTSSISVGLTDRFQLGISYGSANLIGDDSLIWYPKPETNLKYLLIDESETSPGISLGIDTQGLGKFNSDDSLMRYDTKALGLFAVASKNWVTPLGNLGWHFGSNYNFVETNDNDKDVNFFMGFDIEFNPELSMMFEYNAALNENNMTSKNIAISRGGYLNAGVRWTFVERLHIEIDFNNLMFDKKKVDYFNREIKITYIEYF
ncbi:hypothetical protein CM15mP37_08240 [bacterium]|jgi:hypothetical protein|nr:MAG: hypothetical protein CM15mP37_08240 [bacterium]|tara:strand:+ start:43 stop:804 length:762 start_codon:yes stop_codon:yes gene_type:complete